MKMNLIREAVDFLLPHNCCVCGRFPDADGHVPFAVPENFHICFDCLSELVPGPVDSRFYPCLTDPFEGDPIPSLLLYLPFPYKGFFEKAVPAMKFNSHPELAVFSGTVFGSLMKKDGVTADLVVPVPLSASRLKERGYNQAALIASQAAAICGIPCLENVLVRTRDTLRQTEIYDNAHRSMNVNGAFRADPSFVAEGLKVIVIDDVATTGNTLHEAAVALYEAGAAEVLCCALAGNRALPDAESL